MSMFTLTLLRSSSSSAPLLAAVRMKSPKSERTNPGMVVSKSMTHRNWSFSSKSMLLTFVSQWVMRLGSLPSLYNVSALHMSSARPSSSSTMGCTFARRPTGFASMASCNCFKRKTILWKSGMVAPNGSPGRSERKYWNSPKAFPVR